MISQLKSCKAIIISTSIFTSLTISHPALSPLQSLAAKTESQTIAQVKQNISSVSLKPIPLDKDATFGYLDIRGVGDSGMALTYKQPLNLQDPLPEGGKANFGEWLDKLDSTGKSYRGDLSFINWETVVGQRCNKFRGRPSRSSYAFVSHPYNLIDAYRRGFNLIGLANNHSWDCPVGENGVHGTLVSAQYMNLLTKQEPANWIWHGVNYPQQKAVALVKTFMIEGKPIRVAFSSLYLGGACTNITCIQDKNAVLRSLRDANADIRILAMHSWNSTTQNDLVATGKNFIANYNGDIVFGHGPHVWKPVTIVTAKSGKKGVMFESLGNFIHPNLAPKQKDMIGRVLIDLQTLKIKQIQAIPMKINGTYASFLGALAPSSIPASNFRWNSINDSNWAKGIKTKPQGVYYNLP